MASLFQDLYKTIQTILRLSYSQSKTHPNQGEVHPQPVQQTNLELSFHIHLGK